MLIDWFTVCAQAINFVVLAALLKKFLYRPVLAAIDAREQKIAARLSEAASREAQAKKEQEDFHQRNTAFDSERAKLLAEASAAADAERQHLLDEARKDAQALRERLTQAVAHEREESTTRWVAQLQAEVFALARQTLSDLAGASLEERMVDVFMAHAGEWSAPHTARALIRSAFEMTPAQRARLTTLFGADTVFETTPDLVCGIEVTVGGVKVDWTIPKRLETFAAQVTTLMSPEAAHG